MIDAARLAAQIIRDVRGLGSFMLKNLTEEELRLLPSFFENRWLPVMRTLGPPADPDAAFEAIKELCRRGGRVAPKAMRWQIKPWGPQGLNRGVCVCTKDLSCAHCLLARLHAKYIELIPEQSLQLFDLTFGRRLDQMAESWRALHLPSMNLLSAPGPALGFMGRHPVEFDFLDQIGRKRFEFVRPWRQVSLQAGAWWFEGDDTVVFSQRPSVVHRDGMGRISQGDGPAIIYPDGTVIFAWKDRIVAEQLQPKKVAKQFQTSFVEAILTDRLGVGSSALAIEMYGVERFLRNVPPHCRRKMDESKWGILWSVQGGFSRAQRRFVEVKNTTPVRGTRETYVIPVDFWLRPLGPNGPRGSIGHSGAPTALQAIASTFNMTAEEYLSIVES